MSSAAPRAEYPDQHQTGRKSSFIGGSGSVDIVGEGSGGNGLLRAMALLLFTVAVAILALSLQVTGQDFNFAFGNPALCNSTFDDFNASGIYWINPGVSQGAQSGQPDNNSGQTLRSGWAATIQNAYGSVNESSALSSTLSAWYNTNGADYSDDIDLGYDVCAIAIAPLNYNAMLRGQHDNGSCLLTMDQNCVDALKSLTSQHADWLAAGNTGPQLNLTNTSLPGICNDLGAMLTANFPTECSYFFDEPQILDGALTTWNDNYATFLSDDCLVNGTNGTFHNVLNFSTNSSLTAYTSWTRAIYPILTVFMSVANLAAEATISSAVTEITCVHVDNIHEGSYVPSEAPQPTPVSYAKPGGKISWGAISGIVIGVLAGITILGIAIWWFCRKRRSRAMGWRSKNSSAVAMVEPPPSYLAEAPEDAGRHELSGGVAGHELAYDGPKHELPAVHSLEVYELADTEPHLDWRTPDRKRGSER
nr:hypothetical protein CFP56_20327 [Quercus suber]